MLDLDYTGHPFFDVGLAAIVAHAGKEHPGQLEEKHLQNVARFIEDNYTQQPLTSFLTTSLMNSDFTQPAFEKNLNRRIEYARRVAGSFGSDAPRSEEVCVFTGKPALGRALSLKRDKEGREELPPGRAFRQHIPLITGENIINFAPWGDPGLPISGEALLCLQFFPMGCRKCAGRLLAIHSDNPDIVLAAAREAFHENEKAIARARMMNETKLRDASSSAPSLVIETLLNLDLVRLDAKDERHAYSITAYHFTNSGQSSPLDEKSPLLRIYHLPMNIIRFLRLARHPDNAATWSMLVNRGWEKPKLPKNKQLTSQEGMASEATRSHKGRNYFYEDVLQLPKSAHRFVKTYLLRIPNRSVVPGDPRRTYNMRNEIRLISWSFVVLFLKEVIHMEKERIEEIRQLGNILASFIFEQDDKDFFRNFYKARFANDFRTLLVRANYKWVKAGNAPLVTLDPYISVFEEGYEMMSPNWKFARDLVLLHMVEELYKRGWFKKNPDALPDDTDIETTTLESEMQ